MTVVLKPIHDDECIAPGSGPRADPITRTDEAQQTINFYLERADDCRRRAIVAADRSIELIHLDMATRYEMLAREARK